MKDHPPESSNSHAVSSGPTATAAVVDQAGETRSARVESLRALAAIAVLVSHAFAYANGWRPVIFDGFLHRSIMGGGWAVFLFFALSGYLLYRPFARHHFAGGDPIDIRRYTRNRIVRILPLYVAVVAILLVVQEHGGTPTLWWRYLTFTQRFSTTTAGAIDPPTWSLVVEVHFYILLPMLAWALGRLAGGSPRRAISVLLVLGLASAWWRSLHPAPEILWDYSFPLTFVFFVPGMVLAVVRARWEAMPSYFRGATARSSAWLVAGAATWAIVFWRYSLVSLAALASFFVVGAVVLPLRSSIVVRALDWRPVAAVGVASYSLYLWHVPVIEHLMLWGWAPNSFVPLLLVSLTVSLVVAAVSYRVIEAPFLRFRRSWSLAGRQRRLTARPSVASAD